MLSHVQLFETPWIVAHQAPLTTGFSKQGCWSGLPFLPPGNLPDQGIEPKSPALAGGFFTSEPPGSPHIYYNGRISGTLTTANAGEDVKQDELSFIADGNAKQ